MSANPIDLTTVAEVKAYGVLANCTESDQVIQDLITSASQSVINRTGISTLTGVQTLTENYDGNGNSILGLDNQKILSVTSLFVNGNPTQPSTQVNQYGWYIDRQQRFIGIRNVGSGWGGGGLTYGGTAGQGNWVSFGRSAVGAGGFTRGQNNVTVTYTAGFIVPIINEVHTITAGAITPNWIGAPYAFYSNQSVTYVGGAALTLVASAPTAGEYTVTAAGAYGFNATDNTRQVYVDYTYQGPPPDIYSKVTKAVCVEINRLGTLDQITSSLDGGTRRYATWDFSPDIEAVIQAYKRQTRA